jgi:alpha-1,2-mannosyltransferase
VGMSWPWLLAVLVSAVLTGFALRAAVRAGDTLATVVAVQLFGLLLSPISWSHHWVWVIPLVLWAVYGARRAWPVLAVAAAWVVVTGADLITFLIDQQPTIWEIPRPWPLAALGWCYPLLGLLTLAVMPLGLRNREPVAPAPLTTTSKAETGVS